MTLRVHTARVTYSGRDRLDVTRKSALTVGRSFAPSWAILAPALAARKAGDEALAWANYVTAFVAEMRASYREHRADWDWLLSCNEVTLVCYCTNAEHCHRTLLARDLLPKLGAVYCGERQ